MGMTIQKTKSTQMMSLEEVLTAFETMVLTMRSLITKRPSGLMSEENARRPWALGLGNPRNTAGHEDDGSGNDS